MKKHDVRTFSNDNSLVNKRREEIVKAVTSLFIKNGYAKTTTREIAKSIGISIGTLYHYIGSKEDILTLLSYDLYAWTKNYLDISSSDNTFASAADKLRFYINQYSEYVSSNENLLLFWYQEAKILKGEARRLFFDSEQMLINLFEKVLLEGKDSGEFKIDDCTLMASNIIVIFDMWAFKRYYLQKKYSVDEFVNKQISSIFSLILA